MSKLSPGTVVRINGATGHYYRAELPDGSSGFIPGGELTKASKPIRKIKINGQQLQVYNEPDTLAPVKLHLKAGETVSLLGNFNNYQLVSNGQNEVGWIVK